MTTIELIEKTIHDMRLYAGHAIWNILIMDGGYIDWIGYIPVTCISTPEGGFRWAACRVDRPDLACAELGME